MFLVSHDKPLPCACDITIPLLGDILKMWGPIWVLPCPRALFWGNAPAREHHLNFNTQPKRLRTWVKKSMFLKIISIPPLTLCLEIK